MRDHDDASLAPEILCIKGQRALSDFKLRQLRSDIVRHLPQLTALDAHFCYLIAVASPLKDEEFLRLIALIDGESGTSFDPINAKSCLITPRLGTISAWSSKATDIIHRCGIRNLRRIERATYWVLECSGSPCADQREKVYPFLHDRMVESVVSDQDQLRLVFDHCTRRSIQKFSVNASAGDSLEEANHALGLALVKPELSYIRDWYKKKKRIPTDAELMMFSQVNSEHCRHKIFNAGWTIDGENYPESMFSMIRRTHQMNPTGTLVAYEDNSAVIEGSRSTRFAPASDNGRYQYNAEPVHIVFKAETHNHPTAISPFPGAATGAGGEIRDEGATGRGGKPKAGLCGYSVSHLRVPDFVQPWEGTERSPDRISSPLAIMLEAPIGAASFNNEFGRPNIGGYFRTFETSNRDETVWYGYHKPIMFAGGIGNIRPSLIEKKEISAGDLVIVIGGPAMLIGLGGGAASSLGQGTSGEELDFASVQRSNPEMQRRCQEVIDRCCELGEDNPILSIHDVGAGGLSNAVPEIVHASGLGGTIYLDKIPNDDPGMSPMEIWCNESQERYVLVVSPDHLSVLATLCERERCPYSVIGFATEERTLRVLETALDIAPEDMPVNVDMDFLMNGFLKIHCQDQRMTHVLSRANTDALGNFSHCVQRVLRFPSVADKTFLITIGDRTVGGLIHRDQMVGPWQVPVADASVTISGYDSVSGEAMAVGERSPIALVNAAASARMAVAEALTNLRSVSVGRLNTVRMSANWMAAAGIEGQGSALYESVRSVALDMCRVLEISIPVGKDSMSMRTEWTEDHGRQSEVVSPISLIATAFAAVPDIRNCVTPQLVDKSETVLLLIDLGAGQNRMGMSALHQTHNLIDCQVPDVDDPISLNAYFEVVGTLIERGQILAYHDRSDGGLFALLCEMAFASRTGLDITVKKSVDPIEFFFNEELGAVVQVEEKNIGKILDVFEEENLSHLVMKIGTLRNDGRIEFRVEDRLIFSEERKKLHRSWSELSWQMQSLRDDSKCAEQEYDRILDEGDPGLCWNLPAGGEDPCTLNHSQNLADSDSQIEHAASLSSKPQVAVLREQGVNGHVEMAAAFDRAGFDSYDVVMADLMSGDVCLDSFDGIVMAGGFSFGDVLGAGKGWASSILYNTESRDMFEEFFADQSKFALGVCNGCQVMAELTAIIPGCDNWPKFLKNESQQFESRLVMVEISESHSMLTQGLQGMYLPVAVAHGEGRATFAGAQQAQDLKFNKQICLRYIDNRGQVSATYPYNPNGSELAVAGVTNADGRITAMMPHPERVYRTLQYSWAPETRGEFSPWLNIFQNARKWLQ
ncbi:MAG: phosphoribosylformylglycinamidine synthase [Acidiferrobacterales bacterium]|nr:phosphoribosylformylglycinamidine synthase [Acidiferrobacterales bacterium]